MKTQFLLTASLLSERVTFIAEAGISSATTCAAKKMWHRDIQTTMRYVELASKMKRATGSVYVPRSTS